MLLSYLIAVNRRGRKSLVNVLWLCNNLFHHLGR